MARDLMFPGADADDPESIAKALSSIRRHLGMEVAYVSEFVDDRSVFREVDAPGLEALIKVGDSHSLDDVYCRHILAGRLPELMADTADHPVAMSMPITRAVPIGAHMSVPVRLPDGHVYGMFCCLSPTPDVSLNARDLDVMRVFAEMVAGQLGRRQEAEQRAMKKLARIEQAMTNRGFSIVLQPIWECGVERPSGFEALARFAQLPYRSPDLWFKEAAEVDCGVRLEIAALAEALKYLAELPDDVYLSVNASPATITSGELVNAFAPFPAERIMLEVTEHTMIEDYAAIDRAVAPLRARGMRLAVDDAGAGYANFQHILRLAPDMIKLDMVLTRSVDTDLAQRALVAAMVVFARETGSLVVAEGIETSAEWETLRALGIRGGQGFFLGRPADLRSAQALLEYPLPRPASQPVSRTIR